MFDLTEKMANIAIDVATLPFSVMADIVTWGGTLSNRFEPYTLTKMIRIASESADAVRALAE